MEESTINLNNLSYNDKKELYDRLFSLGVFNEINDRLVLISLVSLTYLKLKEKNPKLTPLELLKSITKQPEDNSFFYNTLEALSIIVEDFTYSKQIPDACGLKTSQEIINKIKEILNSWTPF